MVQTKCELSTDEKTSSHNPPQEGDFIPQSSIVSGQCPESSFDPPSQKEDQRHKQVFTQEDTKTLEPFNQLL